MIADTSREVYEEVVKPTAEAVRKKIIKIIKERGRIIQEQAAIILGVPVHKISGRFTELMNDTREIKNRWIFKKQL